MDDFVLKLVICWLAAEDAFSATCVSSEWRAALSGDQDNGALWKQVCQNSFPLVASQLQNDSEMNHRLLTLGLWKGKKPSADEKTTYTPTLAPEQVFAVVDLYRKTSVQGSNKKRKEIISSWVCPISSDFLVDMAFTGDEDEKVSLKGPNPYSLAERESEEVKEWEEQEERPFHWNTSTTPHDFAALSFMGRHCSSSGRVDMAVRVDVTLFRRDTMQSVRILEDCVPNNYDYCPPNNEFLIESWSEEVKFGPSVAGKVARSMLFESDADASCVTVDYCFALAVAKLPAPGSDEEPMWLANCRQSVAENRLYRPTDSDCTALASIPYFEFEVTGFSIYLTSRHSDGDSYQDLKPNEIMVLLEGLCWE